MKRYYYTDPLAAAWMSFRHDMKFLANPHTIKLHFDLFDVDLIDESNDEGLKDDIFYIHPDSLHLLEPQEGDIIDWRYTMPEEGIEIYDPNQCDGRLKLKEVYSGKIISRKGVVFHQPELEWL